MRPDYPRSGGVRLETERQLHLPPPARCRQGPASRAGRNPNVTPDRPVARAAPGHAHATGKVAGKGHSSGVGEFVATRFRPRCDQGNVARSEGIRSPLASLANANAAPVPPDAPRAAASREWNGLCVGGGGRAGLGAPRTTHAAGALIVAGAEIAGGAGAMVTGRGRAAARRHAQEGGRGSRNKHSLTHVTPPHIYDDGQPCGAGAGSRWRQSKGAAYWAAPVRSVGDWLCAAGSLWARRSLAGSLRPRWRLLQHKRDRASASSPTAGSH
jgi:hypothetical protein